MEDIFGSDGLLSMGMPEFEVREGQGELADAISQFLLSDERVFVAEAPTGTGKTYAVMVPAMLWAQRYGRRLLVLTSSVTLQEQLADKDIPALQAALGLELRCCLLKGRGHYACLRKALSLGDEGFLSFDGDDGQLSQRIVAWSGETETGDLAELSLSANHPVLARIVSSHQTCLGKLCPCRDRCFYRRAMRRASESDVVVSNYHKYFAYRLDGEEFPIPCDLIVCDEAHAMSASARSVAAVSSRRGEWDHVLRHVPPAVKSLLETSEGDSEKALADVLTSLRAQAEELFLYLQLPQPENSPNNPYSDRVLASGGELTGGASRLAERVLSHPAAEDDEGNLPAVQWALGLSDMARRLNQCCDTSRWPEWAYWHDHESLKCSPVTGAPMISEVLDTPDAPKIVAVSATMTVDGKFNFWAAETGLWPDETRIMPSPFNLSEQMSVHVVDLGVRVMDREYGERVAKVCRRYCVRNKGATLVLLSSRRLLESVAGYLKGHASADGYCVLAQGDKPSAELLAQFRKNDGEAKVLVGLASFREGVDVAGDALTQVIIDRIPFSHPDDPIVQARRALEGGKYFTAVELPRAKMRLRQAMGRLIRSKTDHGRVVILDSRITQKQQWKFIDSLPPAPLKRVVVKTAPSC